MSSTRLVLSLFLFFLMSPALVFAEAAKGRTILVLDASGSMWGQIHGIAKIEIAQRVIGGLVATLQDEQELGLTAYGHNRKGDCSDIETLVEPGPGTREAISKAVYAIKPKGKTPLSAAVIKAAETLKYTEEKATVILISDGRETCDFDPCEVGKMLEETGVDFTAHVVGFDVAKPADKAQLQCLAENTGGTFLTASDADELTEALEQVSVPEPPKPVEIVFEAIEEKSGERLSEGLVWSLTSLDDGTQLADYRTAEALRFELLPGKYKAEVLRVEDEVSVEKTVTVVANTSSTFQLLLPEIQVTAQLDAPEEALAGSMVEVVWKGPNDDGDYLTTASPGDTSSTFVTYVYTEDGSPSKLQMPPVAGDYDIRYYHAPGRKMIASTTIRVLPLTISIEAADSGNAGQPLPIEWTGPDYSNDYFSVAEIGSSGDRYVRYTYTREGSPLNLELPITPGEYEIRYILSQNSTIAARKPISVLPVEVTLSAPETASAGEDLVVVWQGPDYTSDYLAVAKVGSSNSSYINYTYTRHGSPLKLRMPANEGDFELRYVASQNNTVLARMPIKVAAISARLTHADTAPVGTPLMVEWIGPDYKSDYISIAKVGSPNSKYLGYTYTRQGSPLRLKLPLIPGDYEVRYIQNQGSTVMASNVISVTALDVQLRAAVTAKMAEPVVIEFDGPDYKNDYIAVAEVGAPDTKYIHYTYTRKGSPLRVPMPAATGEYELRYVANGSPDKVLARRSITVEPVEATVSLIESAGVGEDALVEWTGPGYRNDFIGVSVPGDKRYKTYTYVRKGSPLRITMPDTPGTYELRYYLEVVDTVIATTPIEVK